MSLTNWRDNGWLVEHKTSPQEISDLLNVADRDLADCESPGLSPDWQLSIAYNAALQTATAALAAWGPWQYGLLGWSDRSIFCQIQSNQYSQPGPWPQYQRRSSIQLSLNGFRCSGCHGYFIDQKNIDRWME